MGLGTGWRLPLCAGWLALASACGIDAGPGDDRAGALPGGGKPTEYAAAVDASAPPPMAPPAVAPLASACGGSGVEISGGGLFAGTTCGCGDAEDLACGEQPRGRPEATYRFTVPPGRWGCKVTLAEGLSFQITGEGVARSCDVLTGASDVTLPVEDRPGILFGGGEGGRTYYLQVETAGAEPCGDYWVEVRCANNLF